MAKRLSEKNKEEIAQGFKEGKTIDVLSKDFNCNKLTIIRNLKKNLGEAKYKELINKKKLIAENTHDKKPIVKLLDESKKSDKLNNNLSDKKNSKTDVDTSDFDRIESFLEIAPLDIEIDNESRKELSSVHISEVQFPKVVYMIVDKNIELEIKLLKEFPAWDFLPNVDLNRKSIEIYFDLITAKKSCKKDQKVIKVPNTDVFRIVSPILISRGITRIVSSEKLIAL